MSHGGNLPSTIDDVIAYVIALLVQAGEADFPHVTGSGKTEILIGERHLVEEGASRRILFVPDMDPGKLGPVLEIGMRQIGSWTAPCACFVWGSETDDDRDRKREARRIVMRLFAALQTAGVARVVFANIKALQGTNIATYGEEFRLVFEYAWQIPRDNAIELAAAALITAGGAYSQAPPDPDRPTGDTGQTLKIDITMENERP